MSSEPWRTCGDTRERLELLALQLIDQALCGTVRNPAKSMMELPATAFLP